MMIKKSNFFSFFLPKKTTCFISKINGEIKILDVNGKKIIYVKGAEQTGGTITGMWKASVNKLSGHQIRNALILGLGGGDVIRILSKKFPDLKIDCVELDPQMIEVAEKIFHIRQIPKLRIIQADAYKYMKKNRRKYDLI